jgi:hypothetical protein
MRTALLQIVPSNVNADALDLQDFFVLQAREEASVASSHVHWTLRRQIPPVNTDPPSGIFFHLLWKVYIANIHEQLAASLVVIRSEAPHRHRDS